VTTCLQKDKSLQPEKAIDSWREWSPELTTRPVILKSLSGGRSNSSFLLESNQTKLVLRVNGSTKLLPEAERLSEASIWQAASSQGIAPPLLHVDSNGHFLVSRYIHNKLPAKPPFDEIFIIRALELLKRCHQLNVIATRINYAEHIEHYWQQIEAKLQLSNPGLLDQRTQMQSTLKQLISNNPATGICHHDPVTANFVGTPERLYLIDWEYAAYGLLIMDYAALAIEWGIDDATILEHTGIGLDSFGQAKELYVYLCQLWAELKG
jgi:thiamine kinase